MKIIIAPDKYKGNMTSPELCGIIRNEFLAEMPDAEIICIPLADGGDGTTEALTAAHHGEIRTVTVSGPLGKPAAARFGIWFTPGDNHRIPGWMQVHYRLQFDEQGYPRMYVFENCEAFIRTMPLMMYDSARPEDLDTKLEDHCPDEVRYMCMSQPVAPLREAPTRLRIVDPLKTDR